MVNKPVFQIVGFQNSGKTTIMLDLIKTLAEGGVKVATIKHHGHGGMPELPSKKDSARHVEAGAIVSIVEGEGRMVLQAEKTEWSLEEEIMLAANLKADAVLIEGYKKKPYPKAILLRSEEDLFLLDELEGIKLVLCDDFKLAQKILETHDYPVFHDNAAAILWISAYLKACLTS